jgi:site-specific recombinase XerC
VAGFQVTTSGRFWVIAKASINDVKGAPRRGHRIGNGLTREQAQELLSLPDRESLKGKRD